jgi:gliding motility-associated-like protein
MTTISLITAAGSICNLSSYLLTYINYNAMIKLLHLKMLVALLLFCPLLNAQRQNGLWVGKQANNWIFGSKPTQLNFNTSPPENFRMTHDTGSQEGTGTISDEQGNLLFYNDGQTVWNRNQEIMPNGEGLLGEFSTSQQGLTIPAPGNSNLYYIFNLASFGGLNGLTYSVVDMSLDGGLGAVTDKNIQLVAGPISEKMTAVYHADKEQVWLICHEGTMNLASNKFLVFLITRNGINATPMTSSVGLVYQSTGIGNLKASPDGSKIAMSEGFFGVDPEAVNTQILDFNNGTGEISNPVNLNSVIAEGAYSIDFSPNSRFVYVNEFFSYLDLDMTSKLYQFDTAAGSENDILASAVLVAEFNSPDSNPLQVAPDGKIYTMFEKKLSAVNYPNNKGMACGFDPEIDFANLESPLTGEEFYGLAFPSFIQTYFESGIVYSGGQCPGDEISFSTLRIPGITSIVWNFGDTASGTANTSADMEPTHAFTAAGTYSVMATITSNGAEQTATTQVIITAPNAAVPVAPTVCADSRGNVNLTQFSAGILDGQDTDTFSLAYFASEADLASNTPIASPEAFTTSGQVIYARVTNSITGCTTTISFNLVVNPLPVAAVPNAIEICTNTSTSLAFNLTSQTAAILNAQDPVIFTVSYYASLADAQAGTPISNPASFTSTGQTVYAVVTNTATGCVSTVIEFDVIVKQPFIVPDAIATEGCAPFNLTALAPPESTGLAVSYYTAEQDAITATNTIAQFEFYRFEGKQQTVYIRVEDLQGCASIYTLQLQVGNCEIPKGISPNNDGKNDSFDLSGFDVKQLSIYNRYGQQVYSRNNYQSEWHGQADNNNDLPTGTYYYSIEQDGGEQKTGWVYINREVN